MRRRLVLLATAITSMVALAFLVPLALLVRTLAEDRAMGQARQLSQLFAPTVATGDEAGLEVALQTASLMTSDRVTLFTSDDRVLGVPAARDEQVERAAAGEALVVDVEDGRALLTPLLEPGGGTTVVRVVVPDDVRTAGVTASWVVLFALGVVLVLVAVVVADRLARTVVVPARQAARAASALAAGDRTARAPVTGPPEIADVASALNTLADRIDALLAAEREAAADLSHRLRTPMTALRLDVEALAADVGPSAGRLLADLDELEREVDRLIRDARAPVAPRGETVELTALVRGRVDFWSALADEEGRPWTLDLPAGPLTVTASSSDLEAALDALLGNVLAHTAPGTAFGVEVSDDGRTATLIVEDDGPGWPASEVLERGASSRGSTGLGLDIARRAAQRHGGSLRLAVAAGGGARVELRLPLSQPPR